MSIFTNKPPIERPATRLDTPAPDGAMSVIANGMRIVGDVESSGVIKVEGMIEGAVRGARQVLLGRSGVIHGDVHSGEAVIGGKVVGTIVATERVEIQSTAVIEGDIHTKSIVVYEGGSLNGGVRMGDAGAGATSMRLHTPAATTPTVRLAAES